MKYKECLAYKQFDPSKRTRFGLKIYKLCEESIGLKYILARTKLIKMIVKECCDEIVKIYNKQGK